MGKPYVWHLEDSEISRARETPNERGHQIQEWQTQVETQYPELVGHLVWDRDRLMALERAVDQVMVTAHDVPGLGLLRRSVLNRLTGLGPLDELLTDDRNSEIMVNGPDSVFCEQDGRIIPVALEFVDNDEVALLAQRLAHRAGRELTTEHPWCDARLADGSRIHCVLPPVAERPTITIRRARRQPMTLPDFLRAGFLSSELWQDLARWVGERRNIIVAGGAGSGKTSLLRVLAEHISREERLITIEDVRELNLRHGHVVSLETHRHHTLHALLINALRMRPDRIIVGEVRGDEAMDLIEAMQTGHPGSLSTVHSQAGDMRTIYRLARMCVRGSTGIPFEALVDQILSTIGIIVYVRRFSDGARRIDTISRVSTEGLRVLWQYAEGDWQKIADDVDG